MASSLPLDTIPAETLAVKPVRRPYVACALDCFWRQMLEEFRREVDGIKLRLNALLFLAVGAVVDVVLRLTR